MTDPVNVVPMVLFAGAHFLLAGTASLIALGRRATHACPVAILALAGIVLVTLLKSITAPGSPLLITMIRDIRSLNVISAIYILLGLATAVPWLLLARSTSEPSLSRESRLLGPVLLLSPFCIVLCAGALEYRSYRHSQERALTYSVRPRARSAIQHRRGCHLRKTREHRGERRVSDLRGR